MGNKGDEVRVVGRRGKFRLRRRWSDDKGWWAMSLKKGYNVALADETIKEKK